jgi:hypothetical protein
MVPLSISQLLTGCDLESGEEGNAVQSALCGSPKVQRHTVLRGNNVAPHIAEDD